MKKYFILKLNPNRPTFAQDMSEEERKIMQQHVVYWRSLMSKGFVVTFGPVIDPKGVYGIAIVCVDSPEQVTDFIKHDPATSINTYEYYPLMAIMPGDIS
jgi:hypothetical protein